MAAHAGISVPEMMKSDAHKTIEIIKTVTFSAIIVVMLFVCAFSISVVATDVPTFFGQKVFLEKDDTGFSLVKIANADYQPNDLVLCKKGDGFVIGKVENTVTTDNGVFVAVKTDDSFSVFPETLIKGVVRGEIKGIGKVIGFFAEYRFAIVVGCVGFALVEMLDIILSFVKELKKSKFQSDEQ